MTQTEKILKYMESGKGITQAEAVTEFGCYRLSARISDLRHEGYDISRDMVTRKNRYGEPVTFARYKLEAAQ